MSVEIVDGPIVTAFVEDAPAFEKWVTEKFHALDADGNGVLSRAELEKGNQTSSMEFELQSRDEIAGIYDLIFARFDADENGTIDPTEFLELMKEVTLAKARGIGNSPICIIAGIYDLIFARFDADENGTIDPTEFLELMKEVTLAKARGIGNSPICIIAGIYDLIFARFDADENGTIDPTEFLGLMKEVTLAKARGIGNSPICIIAAVDSPPLLSAVDSPPLLEWE